MAHPGEDAMGTWSVALYGNDTSSDIRGDVRELLRTPIDTDAIVGELSKKYPGFNNKSDEEYSDLWLALADQFHAYGIADSKVTATARTIVDTGLDLEIKRNLGMDERDLAKRERVLAELRAKWAKPNPKPAKRKVQTKPDAFLFEIGDCATFPMTEADAALNPYFAKLDPKWKPDVYGAMAVLARGHHRGVFAWYSVARLALRTAQRPALDRCAAAMVEAELGLVEEHMGEKPRLAIFASRLTPLHAKRMQFEVAGRLRPNDQAIREDLADVFKHGFVPGTCLSNDFTPAIGSRMASNIPLSRYLS
jgi:hypothetical protein